MLTIILLPNPENTDFNDYHITMTNPENTNFN